MPCIRSVLWVLCKVLVFGSAGYAVPPAPEGSITSASGTIARAAEEYYNIGNILAAGWGSASAVITNIQGLLKLGIDLRNLPTAVQQDTIKTILKDIPSMFTASLTQTGDIAREGDTYSKRLVKAGRLWRRHALRRQGLF